MGSDKEKMLQTETNISSFSVSKTPEVEEWRHIPLGKRVMLTTWHTLMGCMALLAWNIVLNVTLLFETSLWPGAEFADILLGCNQSGAVLTVLTLIILDRHTYNINLARGAIILALVGTALLPIPSYAFPGAENGTKAQGVYCFIVFLLGVCSGIFNTQGFAFAALLPRRRDQSIFMSTGNGVAGVISWVTFTICFEAIFDTKIVKHAGHLILIMAIISAAIAVITGVVQEVCFKIPLFQMKLQETKERAASIISAAALEEGQELIEKESTFFRTLKQCIFSAFTVGFVLFITIFIFPKCGPLSWPLSDSMKNIAIGVFQILDLLFRFIPALGSWTIFPKMVTRIVVFVRPLVLIPLFVVPAYMPDIPFLSNTYWLITMMIMMVLTNGWGITCAIVHCMGTANNKKEAETTANIMTMCIVLGALLGAFSSKVPVLGLKK